MSRFADLKLMSLPTAVQILWQAKDQAQITSFLILGLNHKTTLLLFQSTQRSLNQGLVPILLHPEVPEVYVLNKAKFQVKVNKPQVIFSPQSMGALGAERGCCRQQEAQ